MTEFYEVWLKVFSEVQAVMLTSMHRPSGITWLVAPGLAMIAVTYGLARFAYGLFLPEMRESLDLSEAVRLSRGMRSPCRASLRVTIVPKELHKQTFADYRCVTCLDQGLYRCSPRPRGWGLPAPPTGRSPGIWSYGSEIFPGAVPACSGWS